MAKRKWGDLSAGQKTMVLTAASVQISLLLTALMDLYRRPAEEVRGNKWVWTAVSFVNFVGPISYFFFGRRRYTDGTYDAGAPSVCHNEPTETTAGGAGR